MAEKRAYNLDNEEDVELLRQLAAASDEERQFILFLYEPYAILRHWF